MRRLSRATWIAIVVMGILTMLASVMGNIGATALIWLSPQVALVLFVLISLFLIGFSLWQERQKAASEPSEADARENRQIMLGRVQNTWITGFLENPLYHSYDEQLLPLPLSRRVGSRFDLVLSNPLEPAQTMPPGTTLAQVFDQAGGELLMLGEPGAGKTTLLLELARDLLKRAKDNPLAPIPVVLMLSSWATGKLPLEQWIAEELKVKYDIPSQIGEAWVKANQLLLLLDGLDEVAQSALPACIDAINEYYHQAHRSLVVCSRTQEFLGQTGRLALHTAVIVQPLSFEQVDTYLDGLAAKGEDVEGLKHVLHQQVALSALAATPLFLTVLILAYHGKPVQELLALVKEAPTDQQHLIFHDYVERLLQREGTRIHATAQQTKHWLAWLARQMTASNQSELYLEQFQPDWLPKRQRAFYQWSIGLFWLFFGLFFGLFSGLVNGLFSGLVGLVNGLNMKIEPTQALTWSWKRLGAGVFFGLSELGFGLFIGLVAGLGFGLVAGLFFGLRVGLIVGLFFGLFFGLVWLFIGLFNWLIVGLNMKIEPTQALTWSWKRLGAGVFFGLSGLGFGLFIGLFGGLVAGVSVKQPTKGSMFSLNEGIRHSKKDELFFGLFIGLVAGLFIGLVAGLFFGLRVGLIVWLFFGLSGLVGGLDTTMKHYTLRFWLWQARCTPAPWRYIAFLDDAVEQLPLRKVGRGYIFRHRLLQDYFASLDIVPSPDLSVRAEARSGLQKAPNGDPSV